MKAKIDTYRIDVVFESVDDFASIQDHHDYRGATTISTRRLKSFMVDRQIHFKLHVHIFALRERNDALAAAIYRHEYLALVFKQRNDIDSCDVVMQCRDGELLAHSFILSMNSVVFKNMFGTNFQANARVNGRYLIPCNDFSVNAMSVALDFMYGKVVAVAMPELHELVEFYMLDSIKKYMI